MSAQAYGTPMPNNTLTLTLNGDVPLEEFAEAVGSLQKLVRRLTDEIASGQQINWVIEDLQTGSAITTVIGLSKNEYAVETVVEAYANIGYALEQGSAIPYSPEIQKAALDITKVLNGNITSIRFETAQHDATVVSSAQEGAPTPRMMYSHGALQGTVQTLSSRRGLRFTLYDPIFDKAISCYLRTGQEDLMRNAWGKKVVVIGRIGREPMRGRAVNIREITRIELVGDVDPTGYRKARGILNMPRGSERAEHVIRRLRDA